MGAAYMAGIAAGVYEEELLSRTERQCFRPKMGSTVGRKNAGAGNRLWKCCSGNKEGRGFAKAKAQSGRADARRSCSRESLRGMEPGKAGQRLRKFPIG